MTGVRGVEMQQALTEDGGMIVTVRVDLAAGDTDTIPQVRAFFDSVSALLAAPPATPRSRLPVADDDDEYPATPPATNGAPHG